MHPEAQRIAIACFMWELVDCGQWAAALRDQVKRGGRIDFNGVPDYLSDLNWMHRAERVMTREQMGSYIDALNESVAKDNPRGHAYWLTFNATAAQRAEAFLRTIGKWTD